VAGFVADGGSAPALFPASLAAADADGSLDPAGVSAVDPAAGSAETVLASAGAAEDGPEANTTESIDEHARVHRTTEIPLPWRRHCDQAPKARLPPARGLAIVSSVQSSTALHVDLADLPGQARALLRLRGPDTERFLQGLLSADISTMKPGQSTPGALLTVKGKIISEVIVLRDEEGFALALPAEIHEAVTGDLDRHIIMDDVTLHPSTEDDFSLVWGAHGELPSSGGATVFTAIHPAPGLLVVGSAEDRRAVVQGIPAADTETFTRHRVATGTPAWGHEIRPDFFPPEVGFVAAVSYDKGCYRGQEPLSRIHSRGQVNRVMARVRARTAPADPALNAESRPSAGVWTSWAPCDGGGVEGLAILHRSVAAPGQQLRAGELAVEVTSGPLGDDPGIGKASNAPATVKLGGRR